jgi:dTDP-4-amino-4,6-dideoxygalactose transaminase
MGNSVEFAGAVEIKHCVSCANGTDALYLAMAALKVRPGSRSSPRRIHGSLPE